MLASSTGKWPRSEPRTTQRDYFYDLALSRLGVEPAELSEVYWKTARYYDSS